MTSRIRRTTTVAALSLLAGGAGVAANASTPAATATASAASAAVSSAGATDAAAGQTQGPHGHGRHRGHDGTGKGHAAETPLSGETADKVKAAVLAANPGATVERMETEGDGTGGVYEAHIVTSVGTHARVALDSSFAILSAETHSDKGDGRDSERGDDSSEDSTSEGGSSSDSGSTPSPSSTPSTP